MTQPTPAYGQQYYDPQAPGTQVFPAPVPHASPYPPQRRWSPATILSVLAFIAASAALVLVALFITRGGSSDVTSHLRTQVSQLQRANDALSAEYGAVSRQYADVSRAQGKISGQVAGLSTTVDNFKPFSKAVCAIPATGSNGAYTAQVPCNPR